MSVIQPFETNEIAVAVRPDVSHLVTEDDTPVDNLFSARQQELLVDSLYTDWNPGEPMLAVPNVGLFSSPDRPVVVPDVLVSLDVTVPEDYWLKEHRSYFVWTYGKAPDVVVEIVSNREGGELDRKVQEYARIRVPYYVVFDPQQLFLPSKVAVYEFHIRRYELRDDLSLPELGLSLQFWQGEYRQMETEWLRWQRADGTILKTGVEQSHQERERANQERERANQERERANQERERAERERERASREQERAERLAAKLRALGIDPES